MNAALRKIIYAGSPGYSWAFLIAPPEGATEEPECIRYGIIVEDFWRALDPGEPQLQLTWKTDRRMVPSVRHEDILARVLIAELKNVKELEDNIQTVWLGDEMHIKERGTVRRSRDWVQRIVEEWGVGDLEPGPISETGSMPSSMLGKWEKVEACCMSFALQAAAQSASARTGIDTIPTFDMLKNTEISS